MTRTEMVRALGNVLTTLDELRLAMPLTHSHRGVIDAARRTLDRYQDQLVDAQLRENDPEFDALAKQFAAITEDVKKTKANLARAEQTLNLVSSLLSVVGRIVTLGAG